MNLPPLPEPYSVCIDTDWSSQRLFTEAQMLALRAATVEACAAEMEGLFTYGGDDVAAVIRGMKP